MQIVKEDNKLLLAWLEKYGFDESNLYTNKNDELCVMVEEDEGSYHPDDPCRSSSYELVVDTDEFIK